MTATVPSTVVAMAAAAAACLAPAVASAQVPTARVVLYEVSESLKLTAGKAHPGVDADGYHQEHDKWQLAHDAQSLARLANASLLSKNVQALDPASVFSTAQYMTATAVSDVSLDPTSPAFGTGPISGKFYLAVFQDLGGNGEKLLSDLVIVNSGTLHGTLDLRAALNPNDPHPIASVAGQWTVGGWRRAGGAYSGVFLIPFQLPTALAKALKVEGMDFYLNPPELEAAGSICASGVVIKPSDYGVPNLPPLCLLSPEEHVLGFPLTKAVIFLFDGR